MDVVHIHNCVRYFVHKADSFFFPMRNEENGTQFEIRDKFPQTEVQTVEINENRMCCVD